MTTATRETNILTKVNQENGKYSAYWAPKVVKQLKAKGLVKVVDAKVKITNAGLYSLEGDMG